MIALHWSFGAGWIRIPSNGWGLAVTWRKPSRFSERQGVAQIRRFGPLTVEVLKPHRTLRRVK